MIKNAMVIQQVKQLTDLQTQIYAFQTKYNCLPGDCPNATTFFGTTDANGYAVANGNGDGIIASTISASGSEGDCFQGPATEFRYGSVPNEVEEVFHQLNLAGFGNYGIVAPSQYAGSGLTNLPNSIFGGGMLVTCMNEAQPNGISPAFLSGTGIVIGGSPEGVWYSTRIKYYFGDGANDTPMITPDMANRLDTKIDNGLPLSGKIGVLYTCSGGAGWVLPPSTYGAMASTCNVSVVDMLWY